MTANVLIFPHMANTGAERSRIFHFAAPARSRNWPNAPILLSHPLLSPGEHQPKMIQLPTFEELRRFVLDILCARADLDNSSPLMESTIFRQGQPCGIEYLLFGPRSVRLSAIWEGPTQRILFYDHNLERFQVTSVKGPDAQRIAERPRHEVATKSVWKGK